MYIYIYHNWLYRAATVRGFHKQEWCFDPEKMVGGPGFDMV